MLSQVTEALLAFTPAAGSVLDGTTLSVVVSGAVDAAEATVQLGQYPPGRRSDRSESESATQKGRPLHCLLQTISVEQGML